jgi:hypothetical protein
MPGEQSTNSGYQLKMARIRRKMLLELQHIEIRRGGDQFEVLSAQKGGVDPIAPI